MQDVAPYGNKQQIITITYYLKKDSTLNACRCAKPESEHSIEINRISENCMKANRLQTLQCFYPVSIFFSRVRSLYQLT